MDHTWIRLFFWIVLCCPVVVAAENGNPPSSEKQDDATAFRDCVLKEEEWETNCSQEAPFSSENPYSPHSPYSVGTPDQERVFADKLVPMKRGVWGPTPAETFRKLYFPEEVL